LSIIGLGGVPGASRCGGESVSGCAQAPARAPTAITLNHARVISACLPIERRCIFMEQLDHGETAKSRDVLFDAVLPRVDLHQE
jgi:hypothetical protein